MKTRHKSLFQRALEMTIIHNGCWLWLGPLDRYGYGRTNGKLVHRVFYESLHGQIPDQHDIDHVCYVRNCINPEHLRVLHKNENCRLQRSIYKTHCKNGHPFDELNTAYRLINGVRTTSRNCRSCQNIATKKYQNKISKKK